MLQQISLFLENRAGQLSEVAALLAERGVDMRALNIAETADYGVLRLITAETERAAAVLKEAGFLVSVTPVIAVAVPDRPGALCEILAAFAADGIDISYMYSMFGKVEGLAYMIFRVTDEEKTLRVLTRLGVRVIEPEELGA